MRCPPKPDAGGEISRGGLCIYDKRRTWMFLMTSSCTSPVEEMFASNVLSSSTFALKYSLGTSPCVALMNRTDTTVACLDASSTICSRSPQISESCVKKGVQEANEAFLVIFRDWRTSKARVRWFCGHGVHR